ncbi:MAG: hypothetical protein ACOY0T_11140 [Myxococcota bacterium]
MRLGALSMVTVASVCAFACVNGRAYHDPAEQGGSAGTSKGGSQNTSGGTSSGGTTGSGGTTTMSGGGPNMSGGASQGGSSSGGQSSGGNSSGGKSAGGNSAGGNTSNGGTTAAGGGASKGGTTGSGGAQGGNTSKGGTTGSGGTQGQGGSTVMHPPPITNGSQGWASRYWDCCKPACGWSGNLRTGSPMKACSLSNQILSDNNAKNACESGGSAYMCWSGVPWEVSPTLALGFVAASGPNYVCGRCYQVQFTGQGHAGSPASPQLNGKTMIVQVINNGGVAQDQFDILIPGGGVGDFNGCSTQWGTSDLGARYGGFLGGCNGDKNCVRQKCQTVFSGKPELMAGCDWFLGWFGGADNPSFTFKQIACPAAITQKSGLSDPG